MKKIKEKLHVYRLLSGFAIKTLRKPRNTSFEVNRERVSRVYYIVHVCKSLYRISKLNGLV